MEIKQNQIKRLRGLRKVQFRHWSCAVLVFLATLASSAQTGLPLHEQNVAVHDPSVIKVADRYYVYGSHGASAWTEDLMNWTQVGWSVSSGTPRHFTSWRTDLAELYQWTNANTLWAPDVIQLEDGRFYYYYCVWTNFYGYRSYLGVAVSDDIEGPYEHHAEILKGGTGVAGFNASVDPNTIDPTLFFDAEEKLQMVYGSYSGGIFIMEMDPETGIQLPGQEWGTHLWGGSHARVEGPYMIYNPDTGYYYLFVSYYGLAASDGYNIRVARSTSPDGPFLDMNGTDMATVSGSDGAIAPHGVKLVGGYRFLSEAGEPTATSTGYLSPGHNSVYHDVANQKYYLFFHTRFVGRGEQHEVRVHQIYFNEDGWPVVAPHRYAGETLRNYREDALSGTWKLVDHGPKTIDGSAHDSVNYTLLANGTISGGGQWELVNGNNLRVTLGGTAYRGKLSHQWDFDNQVWVMAFSLLSEDGTALWGSKVAEDRTSLEMFRLIHFGTTANSGDAADNADPNGNGLPNLLEYAIHADPHANHGDTPFDISRSEGKLSIRFNRILDPALTYTVESDDIPGGDAILWTSSGSQNQLDTIELSDEQSFLNGTGRFIRLKVSR